MTTEQFDSLLRCLGWLLVTIVVGIVAATSIVLWTILGKPDVEHYWQYIWFLTSTYSPTAAFIALLFQFYQTLVKARNIIVEEEVSWPTKAEGAL